MSASTDQPTVLIVEDDDATAELEKRVLVRSGMKTHRVGSVKDALVTLERQSFAAIILDYHLPDGDGWAIVDAAESKQPRIPVVLVTAQGNERIASEAIHRGVADYVRKTETFWDQLPGILGRVTRLVKAEEGLLRLEAFFERASIGAAIRSADGTLERVNQAFAKMHGYTVPEMIGKPAALAFAPEWRGKLPEIFRTIDDVGELRFEAEHVRKDGTLFPVIIDATAVKDAAGNFLYGAAYVQDVTEQRRAERELRASEEKARAILEAIPDLMFRLDSTGMHLDFKAHRFEELYIHPDKIIGANVRDLLPPPQAEAVLRYIGKALATGGLQEWEYELPLPLGSQQYEARMVPCGTDEVIMIVRNITPRKAADAAVRASLREKEVLLQEIHHRVKNNLQVISSLINMQVRSVQDAGSRATLEQCQTRLQAIALIHEKLYQFENYARVPFFDYARTLTENVFHAAGMSREAVSLELAIDDVSLPIDKSIPCGLILNELITNALRHAFPNERRGVIRVGLHRASACEVAITVSDDGVGLPPTFDSKKSKSLGLQLVSTLVEQLTGRLDVVREGGTTLTVTFPVEAEE